MTEEGAGPARRPPAPGPATGGRPGPGPGQTLGAGTIAPHPEPYATAPHPEPYATAPHPEPYATAPHPEPVSVRPEPVSTRPAAAGPAAGAAAPACAAAPAGTAPDVDSLIDETIARVGSARAQVASAVDELRRRGGPEVPLLQAALAEWEAALADADEVSALLAAERAAVGRPAHRAGRGWAG